MTAGLKSAAQDNIREFHFSRNPMVVELLNEYDLVKEFGEGVDRVYRDMAEAGLPEPEYRQSEFMLYATLKNKNWGKEDATWESHLHQGEEKGEETREKLLLTLMKNNPLISMSMITKQTGLSKRQVEKTISTLKAKGKIHREGPDKGGKWIVD